MRIVFSYRRGVAGDVSLPDDVRSTSQRRAVVRAVAESTHSFTVAALHDRARRFEPRLGLATTNRTVELLRANGGLHPLLGDPHTYVRCRAGHHHHLVCTSCGAVEETELCAAPSEEELERRHGFRPAAHELDIYGTCRRCA
jgi:Fur family ferric uptake transcriptional regulator